MSLNFQQYFESAPYHIRRKCKGFDYLSDQDSLDNILPGGQIRYFSRDEHPKFKMGGKVIRKTMHFIEFETKNKETYVISPIKFYVLYKPPRRRKSKQHKLFQALLDSL